MFVCVIMCRRRTVLPHRPCIRPVAPYAVTIARHPSVMLSIHPSDECPSRPRPTPSHPVPPRPTPSHPTSTHTQQAHTRARTRTHAHAYPPAGGRAPACSGKGGTPQSNAGKRRSRETTPTGPAGTEPEWQGMGRGKQDEPKRAPPYLEGGERARTAGDERREKTMRPPNPQPRRQ